MLISKKNMATGLKFLGYFGAAVMVFAAVRSKKSSEAAKTNLGETFVNEIKMLFQA